MEKIAENLWMMRFPMSVVGTRIGRNVTLIRLRSGEVVIHSTAPFQATDIAEISALGQPAALVEAVLIHDTFARAASKQFPAIPYFAPDGFSDVARVPTSSLSSPPESWRGELEVSLLGGAPRLQEHVFFHRPSRTLIVADLLFNLRQRTTPWTRFVFRWISGIKEFPGMSRLYRSMIRDREAFAKSIRQMMEWDFDRVIVGHGDVIETGGKSQAARALGSPRFLWAGSFQIN